MLQGSKRAGRLNLVDLAGSEKVGKTGAKGQTLEEANPDSYISPKSLEAMVENGHRTAEDMARRSPTERTASPIDCTW